LQKSIETKQINTPELIKNVSKTLIEQIEQLARIASDFSQFANIENTQPEVFNVSEIIASLIKLYNTREDVHFVWHEPSEDFLIYADKSQISRLLKNLISNAIEAGNENKQVEIMITQLINNNNIEIAIKDNGTGIDEALKQKLFTPNFTTKSSGTGLGLAICKGIVERANGTISFTTQKNIGTTFFISLPRT
ncbi:MAG TPA: HAMP domain-containing sensor histidine kinase, partial [Chitinophagaceae bacterium]|nr:HAMP domain-containing sensor histidine kinase [Chitinophagaceae bacterium]